MKLLKGAGLAAAVFLIIAFFLYNSYLDLIDPYYWDAPIVKEAEAKGLKVMQRHAGRSLWPWTWVFPFTSRIAFVRPESVSALKQFVTADIVWFNRDDRGRVESYRTMSVFDCEEHVFTTLADKEGRYETRIFKLDGGPVKKWWFDMPDQMTTYFCKP